MDNKLGKAAFFAYDNFAPLIVFVIFEHLYDLKTAIFTCLAFAVLDLCFRAFKKIAVTQLYIFSCVVTFLFGIIDLWAATPFIFKYESVATNLLTAGFFGITLFRGKPIIQELAEKSLSKEKSERPDVRAYLRVLTAVWTTYFIAKAIIYLVISYRYSIDEALAFRSVFGNASVIMLLGGEKLFRTQAIHLSKKLGWIKLPHAE